MKKKRRVATYFIASIIIIPFFLQNHRNYPNIHFLFKKIYSIFCTNLTLKSKKKEKHAVVSGQSTTGMVAAAILAKSGYYVDTYDIRNKYTRNIQWAARQSLVDELASIDTKLEKIFLEKVARPLYRGSIHINLDGIRREKKHDSVRQGNPSKLPKNGVEMMAYPSVVNMEARVFETLLRAYLQSLPNVQCHWEGIKLKRRGDSYAVEGIGVPDLIVIAEGANSKTRNFLGIRSLPMSQSRMQMSGAIGIDSGGVMIKHRRYERGPFIMLTGVMGRKGSGKTWIVADIDPSKLKNQEEINDEFRRLAAASLDLSTENIKNLEIFGSIDGMPIALFPLQQTISDAATAGDNIIFIGDAVGIGHWSVGGGMQIGAVCHAERLKILLLDIDSGMAKKEALQKYSEGVLSDTKAWGEAGLRDFYPTVQNLMDGDAVYDSH